MNSRNKPEPRRTLSDTVPKPSDERRSDAMIPDSTYRLQLNKQFNFTQAAVCVAYLHRLGISHCYTSPYLKARPGSNHGYDIVDHNALNPEIGSQQEFDRFISVLRQHGMGLIADIVPNHMGVMGADNAWWLDVLENGQATHYAPFFDIDWHPVKKALDNKILIPVLGDHYGNILEKQELKLVFDAERGEFSVYYFVHRFPIDPQTYPFILRGRHEQLLTHFESDDPVLHEYQTLDNSFSKLPTRISATAETIEERSRDKEVFKKQLARLCANHPGIIRFIELRVAKINGQADDSGELHALLEQQAYRLSYWRVAGDEINYRRFFDINDLAGLRVEDETVFEASHRFILTLVEQEKIQGLRIDHADGLYDPVAYYRRLKALKTSPQPLYIIAEKIVADYEYLASDWPIHGTTGYEFTAVVNGVFIDSAAEKPLTRTYMRFIGHCQDFDDSVYQAKKYVITTLLAGELNMLANQLSRIAEASSKTRDYTLNALRDALMETVACFPVYRTYIKSPDVRKEDSHYITWAIQQAKQRSRAADKTVFDFVRAVLLLEAGSANVSCADLLKFVMKFQQYTAPVMAKGYEDTALYQYQRLVSLNEVGADPRHFGYSVNAFHHFNVERVTKWPHSLLSLSSHDSKRSADVRARINVLSEIPQQWHAAVFRWRRLNRMRTRGNDSVVISRNDEYLFYQTLVGTWPLQILNETERTVYRERIEHYMIKAVREAKQHSSWLNPNDAYEQAIKRFISRCLGAGEHRSARFLQDFTAFERRLRPAGLYNALSQTVLLLTSPGVPDLYQGSELWQFSLVDPDNRRPVDFEYSRRAMAGIDERKGDDRIAFLKALLENLDDGLIKLFIVMEVLHFRNRHDALFRDGQYLKITGGGGRAGHLLAFARRNQDHFVVIIVPRLTLALLEGNHRLSDGIWQDTWLELPEEAPERYRELFSQRELPAERFQQNRRFSISEVLKFFPFAILSASYGES